MILLILTGIIKATLVSRMAFIFLNILYLPSWAEVDRHFKGSNYNIAIRETLKSTLKDAQDLALSNKRAKAMQLLINIASKEFRKGTIIDQDLREGFNQIANNFYQEATQQNFELSLSLIRTSSSQAFQKMNEALQLEPENLAIQIALSRLHMRRRECAKAEEILTKLKIYSLLSDNLQLALVQNANCKSHKIAYWPDIPESSDESLKLFIYEFQCEKLISQSNPPIEKIKNFLEKMKKLDATYPEILRLEANAVIQKS